ncbi:hypothetical protein JCM10213v2_006056 [Rhodosporidiobolus nylandii]
MSSPPLQQVPQFAGGVGGEGSPELLVSPSSSAPPALSPFATAASSSASAMPPPPLRRLPHGGSTSLTPSNASIASSSSSSSSSAAGAGGMLGAMGRGLHSAKLKDRFGAGVGFAREWGGKGKNSVREGWRGLHNTRETSSAVGGGAHLPSSASSPTLDHSPSRLPHSPSLPLSSYTPSSSSSSSTPPSGASIKLPTTILGVRVPSVRGRCFGVPLSHLVSTTRVPPPPFHVPPSTDEVTGTSARLWLPGIAFRCLEYLDQIGREEEGVYRVPGRGAMVNMLRAMYDAGVGGELDLREIHPGDLDPAAVASAFKGWLRELPEPLLSPSLSPLIDALTLQHLGYSANSSHLLSSTHAAPSSSSPSAPCGAGAGPGLGADGRAPREYTEALREIFAERMEAENYHLLRAIAYHLARLSSHSATNKMTLMNLKLILSPTLRLSPGFLQVLVVEREILFSKANESAKQRQASASSLASPPTAFSSTFPSSPSGCPSSPNPSLGGRSARRRSPTPGSSPLLNPPSPSLIPPGSPRLRTVSNSSSASAGTSAFAAAQQAGLPKSTSNTSAGSWLIVDEPSSPSLPAAELPHHSPRQQHDDGYLSPSHSPVPSPTLPSSASSSGFGFPADAAQRTSPQTPIADRFASTSVSVPSPSRGLTAATSNLSLRDAFTSAPSPTSSSGASAGAGGGGGNSTGRPVFVPSRDRANGAGGGGFFGAREAAMPAVASRKGTSPAGAGVSRPGSRKGSLTPSPSSSAAAAVREREKPTLEVAVEPGRLSLGAEFTSALALNGDGGEGTAKEQSQPQRPHDDSSFHRRSRSRSAATGSSRTSLSHAMSSAAEGSEADLTSASLVQASRVGGGGGVAAEQEKRPPRPRTLDLTLPMPAGLGGGAGIGLGLAAPSAAAAARQDGEGGGFELLSVEERRKFFGG